MIIEVDGKKIDANLLIFDSNSLQIWGREDGKMVADINANSIKSVVIETE